MCFGIPYGVAFILGRVKTLGYLGLELANFNPFPYSLWAMGRTCGHRPLGRTSGRPLADVAKEEDFLVSRSGFLHVAFHEVRPHLR